jgi:hypothetical protein
MRNGFQLQSLGVPMKISERAWQAWSLLAFAARNRQTLTYEILAKLTGMHTAGIGAVLEPIQSYCMLNGLPALSALVVNKATGLPGVGFIAAEDVPREFVRIFEHDWLAVGCPSPDALAEAVRRQPSNGISISGSEPRTSTAVHEREPGGPRPSGTTTKYQPLQAYLVERRHMPRVRMTFADVAEIIGHSLPKSAFTYREWWSNPSDTTNRPQAAAWMTAGFKVDSVQQLADTGVVEFVPRIPEAHVNGVS